MEFRSAIVDECGTVMYWRSELTFQEEIEILDSHPEWSIVCVEI